MLELDATLCHTQCMHGGSAHVVGCHVHVAEPGVCQQAFDSHTGVRLQGSRRHYCIHKTVSKEQAVDEACDKLMQDDGGCRHASRAGFLSNKSDKLKASCSSMR